MEAQFHEDEKVLVHDLPAVIRAVDLVSANEPIYAIMYDDGRGGGWERESVVKPRPDGYVPPAPAADAPADVANAAPEPVQEPAQDTAITDDPVPTEQAEAPVEPAQEQPDAS